MSDIAIRVEGLGKQYRIGTRERYHSLRDSLAQACSATLRWLRRRPEATAVSTNSFWALKDISFEVKRGEAVGVIGRNGAGKSTLLKILSRITEPTTGQVSLHGRVGSLLEVGTGFHPELTGRENVFLNGAILGMTRAEIARKFDEIVTFAEVEKFLDTPVKHYSSGMYMRLAFAVAAHLEPEILIVDEVLAVGDVEFQKKCLGKMGDVAREGRTILFVSHNMQAVASLCTKALRLGEGQLLEQGRPEDLLNAYLAGNPVSDTHWEGVDGDDTLALLQARVSADSDAGEFRTDQPIRIRMRIRVARPVLGLICAVEIYTRSGAKLVYTAHDDDRPPPPVETPAGIYVWELTVPANVLAAGQYRVEFDLGIHRVKRVTSGVAALPLHMENIAGIGRLYHFHTDLVRPAWNWRLVSDLSKA